MAFLVLRVLQSGGYLPVPGADINSGMAQWVLRAARPRVGSLVPTRGAGFHDRGWGWEGGVARACSLSAAQRFYPLPPQRCC